MGEQVRQSTINGFHYIDKVEIDRILKFSNPILRAKIFSTFARINTLYMIARAGSGHIGSSFSSMDILTWLHLQVMQKEDIFFSSKGHDAPAYYATMLGLGLLPFEKIHQLRRMNGLPGHPDIHVPVCATNTGSLGMGISKAKGMLFARQLLGKKGRIFVLMGDGELQEGQVWESLISASNHKLSNLIVIVDHNQLQSDNFVHLTSDLGNLEEKFSAFGWTVKRCNGHDFDALSSTLSHFDEASSQPKALIADTIKGRGVSFMEHTAFDSDIETYRFHSGAPDQDSYISGLNELCMLAENLLSEAKLSELQLTKIDSPNVTMPISNRQNLLNAYSKALVHEANQNSKIIALDADLLLDTGLISFRDAHPKRFVECGIAEQDMVSQAGGMALQGLLPVVHSFACFLSSRANEQIYNNATEGTRIVYVGSLAGVIPGGPGHSHQAVRDIASLSAIPGLIMLEPSCEHEVNLAVQFCLNQSQGASYLRLVSVPCEIPYSLPAHYELKIGQGVQLNPGDDVVMIGYGPVLLSQAWHAKDLLAKKDISVRLINLPWLNDIDVKWLKKAVSGCSLVVTLDNHQIVGGQGQMIAAILGRNQNTIPILHLGVQSIPIYGRNDEVLQAHGLDAKSIQYSTEKMMNHIRQKMLTF